MGFFMAGKTAPRKAGIERNRLKGATQFLRTGKLPLINTLL
jgi:hypothetical protein